MDERGLAVISGASAGIGLATAEYFLRHGYDVVSLSRRICPLPLVSSLQVDLASSDGEPTLQALLTRTFEQRRRVTLVHNAAQSWHDSVRDVQTAQLRSMLELSLIAPAILNRHLIPLMTEGSSIVYLGSALSTRASPNDFSYITAKHAVVGMMRATCKDLFASGIHTACVCPGAVDTPMLSSLFDAKRLDSFSKAMGIGRLIQPQEIAAVVYQVATNPIFNGALIDANFGSP